MKYNFSWLITLDHKRVGMIYTMIGLWSGFIGLGLSMLIRMNLLSPYYKVMPLEAYNFIMTGHGMVMIFFFLMPVIMGGFGNFLLPLLLNLPDLNLPRLNAMSAWLLVPASMCMLLSLYLGSGTGWTFYPPLSKSMFSSGKGTDFLMFSLHLAGVSSIFSSLNFICTVYIALKNKVNYSNVSMMVWAFLFTSMLLMLSLPVLAAGMTMLLFDRNFSSAFFDPVGGGDPVLFQHMFWFFGHPEVYVLMLPGFGFISHITLSVSNGNQPFGYYGLVFAMFSMVCLGCVVWAHHMFAMGMDVKTSVFFSSVTMIMGVPTGMKVFSWLFMLYNSGVNSFNPMVLWVYGFMILFTIGGVTGMVLSASVVDKLLHDTWFVVAHFHYVFSLGSYSSLVMGFMWWWPYITGLYLNKMLLKVHFMISMMGFNLCFFPMHYFGLYGLPRRVCVYDDSFFFMNKLMSLGSMISLFSAFFLIYIIWESIYSWNVVMGIWGYKKTFTNLLSIPMVYHNHYSENVNIYLELMV